MIATSHLPLETITRCTSLHRAHSGRISSVLADWYKLTIVAFLAANPCADGGWPVRHRLVPGPRVHLHARHGAALLIHAARRPPGARGDLHRSDGRRTRCEQRCWRTYRSFSCSSSWWRASTSCASSCCSFFEARAGRPLGNEARVARHDGRRTAVGIPRCAHRDGRAHQCHGRLLCGVSQGRIPGSASITRP